MSHFSFNIDSLDNEIYFDINGTGIGGFVTIDSRTGDYTINRYVDNNNESTDYIMSIGESIAFQLELDEAIEASRDRFNEWDAVSGYEYEI